MLSVRLICVGKLGEKFWVDAVKEYTKRHGAYCKLEIIELPEQAAARRVCDCDVCRRQADVL